MKIFVKWRGLIVFSLTLWTNWLIVVYSGKEVELARNVGSVLSGLKLDNNSHLGESVFWSNVQLNKTISYPMDVKKISCKKVFFLSNRSKVNLKSSVFKEVFNPMDSQMFSYQVYRYTYIF